MYSEQHPRTRPRVSRACQRCRIKKAKCDGAKPCRRCNLDKAPCTYKVRRKTDSANTTQRYTDLLLQHHAALTTGLIELYSRSLKGQSWAGSPVEEVNGIPSVHRILEELGVIEGEDEADTETNSCTNLPLGREAVPPLRIRTSKDIVSGPKIKRFPPMPPMQIPDQRYDKQSSSVGCSPVSAMSNCARIAPAESYPAREEPRVSRRAPTRYMVSSPESGEGDTGTSTLSPWGSSPEFTDELFTTPVPSPTGSSFHPDFQYVEQHEHRQQHQRRQQQQQQQQQQPPETIIYSQSKSQTRPQPPPMIPRPSSQASLVSFDFDPADMYMREPLVTNPLGVSMSFPPTTSTTGTTKITPGTTVTGTDSAESSCGAGYFYDATTGGLGTCTGTGGPGVYGWDYSSNNSSSAGAQGYQDFGMAEYNNSWDSGVFV